MYAPMPANAYVATVAVLGHDGNFGGLRSVTGDAKAFVLDYSFDSSDPSDRQDSLQCTQFPPMTPKTCDKGSMHACPHDIGRSL